jgi:hypothetical protein
MLVVVGLLTVVALGVLLDGSLRRARRERRTAEAIAQAKTPTPFQSAVMALGCSSVPVLPLKDFADIKVRALSGSTADLTLVQCDGGNTSVCLRMEDLLARGDRPPGGLMVVASGPGAWQCQAQFDASNHLVGEVRNEFHTVCFTHSPKPLEQAASFARGLTMMIARAFDR